MTISKRGLYGVIAAGALVSASAGLFISQETGSSGARPSAPGGASATVLTVVQQSRLEHGITAPGLSAQAAVIAPSVRNQFISLGQPLLPAGTQMHIEPATFMVTRSGIAVVTASTSGTQTGRWQLMLARDGANWSLIGTRRLS